MFLFIISYLIIVKHINNLVKHFYLIIVKHINSFSLSIKMNKKLLSISKLFGNFNNDNYVHFLINHENLQR